MVGELKRERERETARGIVFAGKISIGIVVRWGPKNIVKKYI